MSYRLAHTACLLSVWTLLCGVPDLEADTRCVRAASACLSSVDELLNQPELRLAGRKPLVLVHGWNPGGIPGRPDIESWTNFVNYYGQDSRLRTSFKLYAFQYQSNLIGVDALAQAFRDCLDLLDKYDSSGFGNQPTVPIVIVAHSMGGLVSRYALDLQQQDGPNKSKRIGNRVARLITLATPHHGSPMANGPAMADKAAQVDLRWGLALTVFNDLFYLRGPLGQAPGPTWDQANRTDLWWEDYDPNQPTLFDYRLYPNERNKSLALLNSETSDDAKIIAYAGSIVPQGVCVGNKYCWGATILGGVFGLDSDGVVPGGSALFYNSSGASRVITRYFSGYNHTQMVEGDGSNALFDRLRVDLLEGLPPPSPVNLSYSAGLSTVSLLWDAPAFGGGITSYVIEAGSKSGAVDLSIDTGSLSTIFQASAVSAGTYYIRVKAKGPGGIGPASNEVVVSIGSPCSAGALTAPRALTASAAATTVTLSWNAPSAGVPSSYIIEAGSGPGLTNLATTDTGNSLTSFTATGVAGGTYYVRVRAKNGCGPSVPSNEVSVTASSSPTSSVITTVAGNGIAGYSGDGGPGATAQLNYEWGGVAVDAAGNVYIADTNNFRIRKVTTATGAITTVAGNGTGGFSGDGGPATAAQLWYPEHVTVDRSGNVYIADGNERIRKVTAATGVITTVAGSGTAGFSGDGGPATAAQVNRPIAVAVDGAGNLYIADYYNNRIRKVTAATGLVTTIAGSGQPGWGNGGFSGDGGPATAAQLNSPWNVAVDGAGNVYIADSFFNNRIRKVTATTGVITTVAGNGVPGSIGDGGPATSARLFNPTGIAVDAAGNLYISDNCSSRIRKVAAATGVITTVVGTGTPGFSGDGGPATSAQVRYPYDVAIDGAGNLYIADGGNRIRKVIFNSAESGFGSLTLR